jgi:hypothetical protein
MQVPIPQLRSIVTKSGGEQTLMRAYNVITFKITNCPIGLVPFQGGTGHTGPIPPYRPPIRNS